jgi:hypothetical protein
MTTIDSTYSDESGYGFSLEVIPPYTPFLGPVIYLMRPSNFDETPFQPLEASEKFSRMSALVEQIFLDCLDFHTQTPSLQFWLNKKEKITELKGVLSFFQSSLETQDRIAQAQLKQVYRGLVGHCLSVAWSVYRMSPSVVSAASLGAILYTFGTVMNLERLEQLQNHQKKILESQKMLAGISERLLSEDRDVEQAIASFESQPPT